MLDNYTGRFMQEDPDGFDAGDVNLYRYVKNSPMNASDPSGLFERTTNRRNDVINHTLDAVEDYTMNAVIGIFTPAYDRDRSLRNIPRIPRTELRNIPQGWNPPTLVVGGENQHGVITDRTVIGPSGCGPCVGVILIPPLPTLQFYVFHFTSLDNVQATFGRTIEGPSLGQLRIPRGYRAVLCGAEVQLNSSNAHDSSRTLWYVLQALSYFDIPIRGYVPVSSVFVDRDGNLYADPTLGGVDLSRYR